MQHVPMHVCQAKVTATMPVGQLLVIDSKLMQDGRPNIIDLALVLHCVVAEFIGCTVDCAAFCAAAAKPRAKSKRVVVSPVAALRERRAAKFASPDNQGVIE